MLDYTGVKKDHTNPSTPPQFLGIDFHFTVPGKIQMETVRAPCLSPSTMQELFHSAWPHVWTAFLSSVPKSLGLAASRAKVTPLLSLRSNILCAVCCYVSGHGSTPCSHAWTQNNDIACHSVLQVVTGTHPQRKVSLTIGQ